MERVGWGMCVDPWRMEATEISRGFSSPLRQRWSTCLVTETRMRAWWKRESGAEVAGQGSLQTASRVRPRPGLLCSAGRSPQAQHDVEERGCISQRGWQAALGLRTVALEVRITMLLWAFHWKKLHGTLQERWCWSRFTGEETESQRGLSNRSETTW